MAAASLSSSLASSLDDVISDESDELETPLEVWQRLYCACAAVKAPQNEVGESPEIGTSKKAKHTLVPPSGRKKTRKTKVAPKKSGRSQNKSRKINPTRIEDDPEMKIEEESPPNPSVARQRRRPNTRRQTLRRSKRRHGNIEFVSSESAASLGVVEEEENPGGSLLDTPLFVPEEHPSLYVDENNCAEENIAEVQTEREISSPTIPKAPPQPEPAPVPEPEVEPKTEIDDLFFSPGNSPKRKPPPRKSRRKEKSHDESLNTIVPESQAMNSASSSLLDDDSLWG